MPDENGDLTREEFAQFKVDFTRAVVDLIRLHNIYSGFGILFGLDNGWGFTIDKKPEIDEFNFGPKGEA